MKILITGATGFLGKYVTEELLAAKHGYEIVALGRNSEKGKKLVRQFPSIRFIQGDFTDESFLETAAKDVDAVIHCGALSTVWGEWEAFYRTNVTGTENVLKVCRKFKIARLIYLSSPSIYTRKEDQYDVKEEDADVENRMNHYIKSKLLSEKLFAAYSDVPSTILRPRGLFGAGDQSIIPRVLKLNQSFGVPLLKNGRQLIELTCVENAAYAIRLALENPAAVGKTYNVTNGEAYPFMELMTCFFDEMGEKPAFRPLPFSLVHGLAALLEAVHKSVIKNKEPLLTKYIVCVISFSLTLNIEKITADLGYVPKMSVQEGIRKYVETTFKD